jgi:Na+-translocating ferredoxin:NAD+ oxidoreductase RnfD subunit
VAGVKGRTGESFARLAHRSRRYVRTPKGRLLILFGVLAAAAAARVGSIAVGQAVVLGSGSAALIDVALRRLLRREWAAPTGALLTGTDAALVLSLSGAWFALPVAVAVGIVGKHVVRTRTANVFNPSALGLVFVSAVLGQGLNWWGSLPDSGVAGLTALIVIGALTVDHVNKLPLVLAFLVTYFAAFDVLGLAIGGDRVAEIFVAPDINAAVFFACFMLTDPPTSPVRYFDQLWYGALVALLVAALFTLTGASYFLPGALLLGNVVEATRRALQTRRRQSGRSVARRERTLADRLWASGVPRGLRQGSLSVGHLGARSSRRAVSTRPDTRACAGDRQSQ